MVALPNLSHCASEFIDHGRLFLLICGGYFNRNEVPHNIITPPEELMASIHFNFTICCDLAISRLSVGSCVTIHLVYTNARLFHNQTIDQWMKQASLAVYHTGLVVALLHGRGEISKNEDQDKGDQ